MRNALAIFALSGLVWLVGCTSPDIYRDPDFNPPVYWGSHVVREGDTLYSIAWRYGRDVKDIASANRLSSPYRIVPGQRLTLVPATGSEHEPPQRVVASESGAKSKDAPPEGSGKTTTSSRNYKNKQSPAKPVTSPASSSPPKWQWPHPGPIIDTFSVTGRENKGIDIAGKIGEPVRAASAGEVVYAGSGLIGYGLLIIINHDDEYLSAYAHNRKALVKEGATVKGGQVIAELGDVGTNRPKLHFEIRKNGQPVNPLKYLPRR